MVTFLTKSLPRYGAFSGYYSQVMRFARQAGTNFQAISPQEGLVQRTLGKAFSLWLHTPARNQSAAAAEFRFRMKWQFQRKGIFHILNMDDHLSLLDSWISPPSNLVATLHHPPSNWHERDMLRLSKLSMAIVLCQRDAAFFSPYVRRVQFIPHGVDTDFFTPSPPKANPQPTSLLIVGNWLRDFSMAAATVECLAQAHPSLRFDFVVEQVCRKEPALARLDGHPAVRWHHGISDEDLRELYRKALVLFLPLQEASANNAIVEALACGLPIVTNRVGGIADYGGGSCYELVEEPGIEAFARLILSYVHEPRRRHVVGSSCRQFAEGRLAWPQVWAEHERAYSELAA
jgi:glycosyltransferase involved in cell wall biosynthesis